MGTVTRFVIQVPLDIGEQIAEVQAQKVKVTLSPVQLSLDDEPGQSE